MWIFTLIVWQFNRLTMMMMLLMLCVWVIDQIRWLYCEKLCFFCSLCSTLFVFLLCCFFAYNSISTLSCCALSSSAFPSFSSTFSTKHKLWSLVMILKCTTTMYVRVWVHAIHVQNFYYYRIQSNRVCPCSCWCGAKFILFIKF